MTRSVTSRPFVLFLHCFCDLSSPFSSSIVSFSPSFNFSSFSVLTSPLHPFSFFLSHSLSLSLSLSAFTSSSHRNLSLIVFFIYSLSLFLSSLGIHTQSIFLPTRNPNFFNNTKKAKRPGLEFHLQPETSKATNGVSLPDAGATFFRPRIIAVSQKLEYLSSY